VTGRPDDGLQSDGGAASASPVIAVLGLGEAGGAIARDLVAAGAALRVWDPLVVAPSGATACSSDADACAGASLVLSINSAADAPEALDAGLPALACEAVWADLNTASPALERHLAERAAARGIRFADVSLMAPVPGRGLSTPMLVSGTGATFVESTLTPLGATVETVSSDAGEAATRKLLRSVFLKGMAAAVTEAMAGARAAGLEDWMWEMVGDEFAGADAALAHRLVEGSVRHAVRREHEMVAASELLDDLDVPSWVAVASQQWLRHLSCAPTSDSRVRASTEASR
jgi:3-hydroxyisobutyrate dehydrogenase-like beta-hydroxyacid dehydrogenase